MLASTCGFGDDSLTPVLGTQHIEEVMCKVGDEYVMLVDTPGFNDTYRTDIEVLTELAEWLKDKWEDDLLLSGIIYLHPITDEKMYGSNVQSIRMFRKMCGNRNLNNVMLATTKWENESNREVALAREEQLKATEGFWGTMIAYGSKVGRCENTPAGAERLVTEVLDIGKDRFMPKMQKQLGPENKHLLDTDAGAELSKALKEMGERHKKDTEDLKAEMEMARAERKAAEFCIGT